MTITVSTTAQLSCLACAALHRGETDPWQPDILLTGTVARKALGSLRTVQGPVSQVAPPHPRQRLAGKVGHCLVTGNLMGRLLRGFS